MKIRIEAADVAELERFEAALAAIADVGSRSRDYRNRRDPGMRRYLEDVTLRAPAGEGYAQAVAALLDVARRTGSPAAKWAADYLTANPDRAGETR